MGLSESGHSLGGPFLCARHVPNCPGGLMAGTSTGLRVLVVDDHADTLTSTRLLLACGGHDVHEASCGEIAIKKASTVEPQLMLVDLAMPGIDGYTVARRLREQPEFATTPLVAVSGYGDAERLRQSLEAGFDDHLVKPVTPRRLLDLLNRVRIAVATSRRLIEISDEDVRRTIERGRPS
ncbi:MAG: response regulator [Pirellulales bacterium]